MLFFLSPSVLPNPNLPLPFLPSIVWLNEEDEGKNPRNSASIRASSSAPSAPALPTVDNSGLARLD